MKRNCLLVGSFEKQNPGEAGFDEERPRVEVWVLADLWENWCSS